MLRAELNQEGLSGGQRMSNQDLARVLKVIEKTLELKLKKNISIAFISSCEIRKLNRKWRGKDKITDVLSFSLDEPETAGEVVICYDRAKKQAREYGHSTRDEVELLLVHGILHIFGYDHETEIDSKKMFKVQNEILRTLGVKQQL